MIREVEATVRRVDWLGEEVGWPNELNDRSLADAHIRARGIVHERLLDNFDTKSAMEALLSVIGEANAYLRDSTIKPSVPLLRAIATYVTRMLKVFGVADGADDFGFGSGGGGDAGEDTSESSAVGGAMKEGRSEEERPWMDTFTPSVNEHGRRARVQNGGDRECTRSEGEGPSPSA